MKIDPPRVQHIRDLNDSSPGAPYLEILIREVEQGHVSRLLRKLRPGDALQVDGPFGFFTIDRESLVGGSFIFVGTGTGISPFHCMASAYADLDYTLVHGVRYCDERYDYDHLRENPVNPKTSCYLCGNCDMIYEAFDILKGQGVPPEQLFAEVYF